MRSAATAAALIACLAAASAARLHGTAEPDALPLPPGLGLGRPALAPNATLRGDVVLSACPVPIGFAVVPAHAVSIDPGLVSAAGPGRVVVIYGGLEMPRALVAESVNALHLARRLAQAVGLSRASFGSTFAVRFELPLGCDGLAGSDLARVVGTARPAVSVP